MSAVVAHLPVDVELALLRSQAAEQLERARFCARQSDSDGEREARVRAADLHRRIRELQAKQK